VRFLSRGESDVERALETGKVAELAARALKEPEVLKQVADALDSNSSIARGWAAHVLGNIARAEPEKVAPSTKALVKLALDSDDWVACWGLYALAELAAARPGAVVDHIDSVGKRLGDPIVIVATRAAQVVGNVGAAHPERAAKFLGRLRELADIGEHAGTVASGKWGIRSHKDVAEEAIRKIEGAAGAKKR
jgi:hypothetical protein